MVIHLLFCGLDLRLDDRIGVFHSARSSSMAEQDVTIDPITPCFSLRSMGVNVLRMTLLWLAFGPVVGVLSSPLEEGFTRMVAGVIAGVIVCVPFGVLLGLIGGQWRESLVGGMAGLTLGLSVGMASGFSQLMAAGNVGLVGGAMVGATVFTYLDYAWKAVAAVRKQWIAAIR
jgi:hypothetical protein